MKIVKTSKKNGTVTIGRNHPQKRSVTFDIVYHCKWGDDLYDTLLAAKTLANKKDHKVVILHSLNKITIKENSNLKNLEEHCRNAPRDKMSTVNDDGWY